MTFTTRPIATMLALAALAAAPASADTLREALVALDDATLDEQFKAHEAAYRRIFTRCGLEFVVADASNGSMGGAGSSEFVAISDAGEDFVVVAPSGAAANLEVACSALEPVLDDEVSLEPVEFETPDVHTIADLEQFQCGLFPDGVPATQQMKTLVMIAQGEAVVWLSPSTRWTNWLVARGWPRAAIDNLPDHRRVWETMSEAQARDRLAPFEAEPTMMANNIVRMCRGLVRRPPARALAYLAVAATSIDRFCSDAKVEVIIGEATWGFELTAWLVAQKRGIAHLNMVRTRLPNDRICLVDAVRGTLIAPNRADDAHADAAREFYLAWTQRPRPTFGATLGGAGIAGIEWAWLGELGQIARRATDDRGDETLWPLRRRVGDRMRRLAVERRIARWLRAQAPAPDAPYLLYCLHHQPEAAIDVVGAFNSDQFRSIETIARLLPATHRLHVRAHRAGLADFGLDWWHRLAHIAGVVDPFDDIWPQMKGSVATVTVCGTVLYEAALLGVPALGLGPVHFDELYALPATRRSTPLDWPIDALLDPAQRHRFVSDEPTRLAYLAKLFANSTPGALDDLRQPREVRDRPDWQHGTADFMLDTLRVMGAIAQPAKYDPAPAEDLFVWANGGSTAYVTDPNARGVRYEIGADGKVKAVHAGGPSIQLVEGCS